MEAETEAARKRPWPNAQRVPIEDTPLVHGKSRRSQVGGRKPTGCLSEAYSKVVSFVNGVPDASRG